ncbi:PDZ domain (Also known as DHR or GLGF) [compost metagenome]
MRTGDRILEIDGQPTAPMQMEEAVERIRGRVNTPVSLTVVRGKLAAQTIALSRRPLP